jgi:hypothetical protein
MTQTQAASLTGAPAARLGSFGINMGAADEVMAVIGEGAGNGSHGMKWCHGSSAGFTAGSFVIFNGGNGSILGSTIYGDNRWINVMNNLFIGYVQWCDRNGGSPNYNTNGFNTGGLAQYLVRAGIDGPLSYMTDAYMTTQRNNIVKISADGGTLADIATAPFPSISNTTVSIASSPDGTFLMSGDPAGIQSKKSADGGATWGNIGIVGSYGVFYCYGANNLWITEGAYFVKYSTDGGDTWNDITGDLWTWLPVGSVWGATYIIGW